MKKNDKIRTWKLWIFAIFLLTSSCEKTLETNPKNLLLSTSVFSTDQSASEAVNAIYFGSARIVGLSPQIDAGALTICAGIASDEIAYSGTSSDYLEFANNNLLPTNGIVNTRLWSPSYTQLYLINSCLEGLNESNTLTPAIKTRLIGECKVWRAFYLYHLIRLYGEVPLVLTTDYLVNANIARSSISAIEQQIVSDLVEAETVLPLTFTANNRSRVISLTASAFLARVYLDQGKWEMAKQESDKVINSGLFSLQTDLNTVFLLNANESIWQHASNYPTTYDTNDGALFIPSSATAIPPYPLTSSLVNIFETGDKRRTNWIKANVVSGTTYNYPYKYKKRRTADNTAVTEADTYFRLAEQYLIRSEAKLKLGDLPGAVADLNIIRNRARDSSVQGALPAIGTTLSESQVFMAIKKERRTEFFCEWGHRWFDLQRWGDIDAVLSAVKPGWQSTDALFPIPQAEINKNPSLTQNKGY